MPERDSSSKLFRLLQVQAGVSRRKAQELIAAGEVTVNGKPVADPFADLSSIGNDGGVDVKLRGHPIALSPPEHRVYRFHKPVGMLCSHDDPCNGNTVGRVLRAEGFIGYTWAGRLDQDAEGLLLLSNCGDLINYLTHPRYGVPKQYAVWTASRVPRGKVREMTTKMCAGVIEGGDNLRALEVTLSERGSFRVTLAEGKKHEVKRLFSFFGVTVKRLQRIAMGTIQLRDLRAGAIERLSEDQEQDLLRTAFAITGKTCPPHRW